MEMPFVSIIVPVYNAQSHLSRCLESICGQEYKNLELIVINDMTIPPHTQSSNWRFLQPAAYISATNSL